MVQHRTTHLFAPFMLVPQLLAQACYVRDGYRDPGWIAAWLLKFTVTILQHIKVKRGKSTRIIVLLAGKTQHQTINSLEQEAPFLYPIPGQNSHCQGYNPLMSIKYLPLYH
jgi:hypothetical protein